MFSASSALAAELSLEAKNTNIQTGSEFEVGFFLNTENENINAIEGGIVFPENLLQLKEIRDGNSIINLWIQKPENKDGEIAFSGITPGGYLGRNGLIFSLVFQSTGEGQGLIEAKNIKVLINDGAGTEAKTKISNLQLVFSKQTASYQAPLSKENDADQPEIFKPIVTQDPTIFNGQYFLVFATQDKGSGINHYEVREGSSPFIIAQSPYLLQDQKLDKKIYVKAVDKSGNQRIVTLPPQKPLPWYQNYWILAILIIVVIIMGITFRKILWKRFIKLK